MTMVNRYQNTIQGNLIQIGNTLGLSKDTDSLTPGTLGSIGAFITTQSISAPGWPINTTLNYPQNSSPALLNLPPGAVVEHAELIWSASYVVTGGDVTANINDSITLTDPNGVPHTIPISGVNFTGIPLAEPDLAPQENSLNYVNSADVTTIVNNAGSGTYICGNVPCTMSATSNFLQYAGWSLYVAYSLFGDRVRNIIIFVGDERSIDVPYSVPINYPGPPFPIRMFYTAGEGDAIISGEQYNTRPGLGVNFYYLGTNVQPASIPDFNPFSSQITDQVGNVDTFGPFGTVNQDGITATNVPGGRQGWDTANNVNLLPAFTGGPVTDLGLDIGTNNDPAILTANGFVVDLNQPLTSITKSVSTDFARANNTLTYTLVYDFNQVPVPTTTIVLVDTTPNGATFVPGSVVVNGVPQPLLNPNPPGIPLGNINTPTVFTVNFNVTVDTVTNFSTVSNNAYGSYHFQSGGVDFFGNTISNTVNTLIDVFNATISEGVDKSFSFIGDTLTYTVTLANNGGEIAFGVFSSTLASSTTFINNTFTFNGAPILGANPQSQIIGPFDPDTVSTVTFQALVNTVPNPNTVPNNSNINFNYSATPTIVSSQALESNTVVTQVNSAVINSIKSTPQTEVSVGDIVNYTVVLTNTGNATANNLVFIDTIPNGTSFVPNSLFLNGIPLPGQSPAPPGFNAGIIAPGARSTITFNVHVDTIPSPNPFNNSSNSNFNYIFDPTTGSIVSGSSNSNIVQVFVKPLTTPIKSVGKQNAGIGDTLTYTVTWRNEVTGPQENLILYDTIPNGTTFVPNSVFVNGVNQPGVSPAPPGGLSLGNLSISQTVTVTFNVTVNTIPNPNPIPNQALMQYSFQPDIPGAPLYTDTRPSNIVNTQINFVTLGIAKATDKKFATCKDIITYTISVPNNGSTTATNVIVSDTVPNGTTFVSGSILVNGIPTVGNPSSIGIGNISPGGIATVSFKVQVQC